VDLDVNISDMFIEPWLGAV